MPYKPIMLCRHPGCAALVPAGQKYCEEHKPLHSKPAAERGYGYNWWKASKEFLVRHLMCMKCRDKGNLMKATVVDHIIPYRGDQKLFWDQNNWQSLCKKHHDQKTSREDARPVYYY